MGKEDAFNELIEMMDRLRGPDGCPWDKEQDHRSLERYVIEEAYEVVEAIERDDFDHLTDELGDLLLQVVFQSQIAKENGHFDIWQVIQSLNAKLKRRHPHIFGDTVVAGAAEVKANWERIKLDEKRERGAQILAEVPRNLPALLFAYELQDAAATVGFDWPDVEPVFAKIREEISELEESMSMGADIKAELGDVFFGLVNLCRHLKVDPEIALRRTSTEFDERFKIMEELASRQGTALDALDLIEQDKLWEEAKAIRRKKKD